MAINIHNPEKIFIVYGTLAPNKPNHFVIEHIKGTWQKGIVKGQLVHEGWGADLGYFGFKPDLSKNQENIDAYILFSDELPSNWQMLDEFEGSGYKRILATFELETGEIGIGNIYAINENEPDTTLVDKPYLVEKMAGKGGWHYVEIPEISKEKRTKLNLVRVRGFIDTYELKQFNLLPMKNGSMFLPLKTAVRKKIGKKEGDFVHVTLFSDDSPVVVPDEILVCLLDSPQAHQFFLSLSGSNQKYYIDWIEDSKKLETKGNRIAKMIEQLEKGVKFYDWPLIKDN